MRVREAMSRISSQAAIGLGLLAAGEAHIGETLLRLHHRFPLAFFLPIVDNFRCFVE